MAYIDDSLLQSECYERSLLNLKDTVELLDSVGLITHPDKSILPQLSALNL